MKPTLLVLAAIWLSLSAAAQDTSRTWTFRKAISYTNTWQGYPYFSAVRMPSALKLQRRNTTVLPLSFDSVSDNPLRHAASYIRLHTESAYGNRVSLFADLYAEHRGASYGLFDTKNMAIYPVVRLEARDTLKLFGKTVHLQGKAGQFLDQRLDEGLMIYNIDEEGARLTASSGHWQFRFDLFSDMFDGIGLNIDDLFHYECVRTLSASGDYLSFSYSAAPIFDGDSRNSRYFSVSARKQWAHAALFAEAGHRPVRGVKEIFKDGLGKRSAFVIGLEWHQETKAFASDLTAEVRYYGETYNIFHSDTRLRYRDTASDIYTLYANTVGRYLYPLRKFETPFSQWAVFTEYMGYDLLGLTLRGNLCYRPAGRLGAYLRYDLNFIGGHIDEPWAVYPGQSRNTRFLYPFFDAGLTYRPAPFLEVSAFATNRTMNLDLSYPTQYLLAHPCFGTRFTARFD